MQSGVSRSRSTLPVPMHRHANLCRMPRKCGNVKGNETTYLASGGVGALEMVLCQELVPGIRMRACAKSCQVV